MNLVLRCGRRLVRFCGREREITLSCFADGGWNVKVDGTSGVGMGERKVREKWKIFRQEGERRPEETGRRENWKTERASENDKNI